MSVTVCVGPTRIAVFFTEVVTSLNITWIPLKIKLSRIRMSVRKLVMTVILM